MPTARLIRRFVVSAFLAGTPLDLSFAEDADDAVAWPPVKAAPRPEVESAPVAQPVTPAQSATVPKQKRKIAAAQPTRSNSEASRRTAEERLAGVAALPAPIAAPPAAASPSAPAYQPPPSYQPPPAPMPQRYAAAYPPPASRPPAYRYPVEQPAVRYAAPPQQRAYWVWNGAYYVRVVAAYPPPSPQPVWEYGPQPVHWRRVWRHG